MQVQFLHAQPLKKNKSSVDFILAVIRLWKKKSSARLIDAIKSSIKKPLVIYAPLAQRLEQLAYIQSVACSNQAGCTNSNNRKDWFY